MAVQCVVSNSNRMPLSVVPAHRGFRLLLKGKAQVLTEHAELRYRTSAGEYAVPTAVVLKEYCKTGRRYYREAQLNQRNLFVRDNWTCQYCQRHRLDLVAGSEYLTRDHIQPKTDGGADTWTNVVTACSTCNHRKDDHSLGDFVKSLTRELDDLRDRMERAPIKERDRLVQELARWELVLMSAEELRKVPPGEPTVVQNMLNKAKQLARQR
jgi:hypothetical protein